MALERGGSLRVGLEDAVTGQSNVEQIERPKELVDAVGRRMIKGPEAIEYLDIPFPATRLWRLVVNGRSTMHSLDADPVP
jgi:hypothetical protein